MHQKIAPSSAKSHAAFAGLERLSRRPPTVQSGTSPISVLSVSPFWTDHNALEQLLHPPRWTLRKAQSFSAALALLANERVSLVVCESDLGQESWREVLAETVVISDAPFLIVTSQLADERLWVDALDLGAYDVLVKPFDTTELTRVLNSAWLNWHGRHDAAAEPILLKATGA